MYDTIDDNNNNKVFLPSSIIGEVGHGSGADNSLSWPVDILVSN